MTEKSRIRLNPSTKEIEIEGTEQFVSKYFDVIHKMILASRTSGPIQKTAGAVKPGKRTGRPGGRGSKTNAVLDLVQGSKKGVTTTELEKKTGLSARQIWAILYKAKKEGKVKKAGRGVYIAA